MAVNGIYVLQGVNPSAIAAAPVDIKVVEIYNDNGQLFSASQVAQMGGGPGNGTVLGYFSIGEAENYRDYFNGLSAGTVGPQDPSWPGNFYVKYWTDEWANVCKTYIDRMIAQGYDGIYFDVVDVAERSWARNNDPSGDSRGDMIRLVQELADYAHAKVPGFKIWVNTSGAEPMLNNPAFVAAVDGSLEEELFYQDNGSTQRAADVQFNLDLLHKLTAAGKPVIAVEYVTGSAKVQDVHNKAAAAGIGSYVAKPDLELNGVDTEGFAGLPPPEYTTDPNPPPPPPPPPPDDPTNIVIPASETDTVVNASNVTITATAGDHMLFIGGTNDKATLTGGTESVQAYQGHNTIITGAGNDTIRIAGEGNRVDAGAGVNHIEDSGANNVIVMPGARQGMNNIFGPVLSNGDKLDFTAALNRTDWNGRMASVGKFLHVSMDGNDAVISVSNRANRAGAVVGTLHDSGPLNLQGLLAHSIV